jgi:hypothetical protein
MRYWSTTHQHWRTLITAAHALSQLQSGEPRRDFATEELQPGRALFFQQVDTLTGSAVFRLTIQAASADRLVFEVENVTTLRYFRVPLFGPGEIQSIYFLDRESEGVWRYYSIARTARTASRLVGGYDASAINRAVAYYRSLVGIPTDQEPPAAR